MHYPQYFCTLCDLSQLNNYYEDSCIYPSLCSINENEDIVLQSESNLNVKGGAEILRLRLWSNYDKGRRPRKKHGKSWTFDFLWDS